MSQNKYENTIFDGSKYENPKYDTLIPFRDILYKAIWTPFKYKDGIKRKDVPFIENRASEVDRNNIKKCIIAVAVVEDKVKKFWGRLDDDLPQTIISDIAGVFGQSETTHRISYNALNKQLKIDVDKEIEKNKILKDRVNYLQKYLKPVSGLNKETAMLRKLILFTALVERASLFTQFYILMSYSKHNKGLKTMSALQKSTAIEEDVHYSTGLAISNIIKSEFPEAFTKEMLNEIREAVRFSYQVELSMIKDFFYEGGRPDHIEEGEVENVLSYNFRRISKDFKLEIEDEFPLDTKKLEERSLWFTEETKSSVNPDFFDTAVGGYSMIKTEINVDENDNFQY